MHKDPIREVIGLTCTFIGAGDTNERIAAVASLTNTAQTCWLACGPGNSGELDLRFRGDPWNSISFADISLLLERSNAVPNLRNISIALSPLPYEEV